jgi:oligosaccharide repeat unit polymerase
MLRDVRDIDSSTNIVQKAEFMTVLIIVIALFGVQSLIMSNNSILSPGFLTSVVWLFMMFLYNTIPHRLPQLSDNFCWSLGLWTGFLCIGTYISQIPNYKVKSYNANFQIRTLFFVISLLFIPSFIFYVYKALSTGASGNWAMDLRLASTGSTKEFKEVYGGWQIIIWQMTYLIELYYYSRYNRNKVIFLAVLILSFGFFTMSKAVFLDFIVKTFTVVFFRRKIKTIHFLYAILGLFMVFLVIQSARSNSKVKTVDQKNLVVGYALGNLTAFETLSPESSEYFGQNVFRIYYAITEKVGLSDRKPIDTFLPFVSKPVLTNTYTAMYPFYKDFGNFGIALFALLYGLLFGWTFKKAQLGSSLFILIFSCFTVAIVMQYAADVIITNLSAYIKQIAILTIPFMFSDVRFRIKSND